MTARVSPQEIARTLTDAANEIERLHVGRRAVRFSPTLLARQPACVCDDCADGFPCLDDRIRKAVRSLLRNTGSK